MSLPTRQSDDEGAKAENGPSKSTTPSSRSADREAGVNDPPAESDSPTRPPGETADLTAAERDILFAMTKPIPIVFDQLATKTGFDLNTLVQGLSRLLDMDLVEQRKAEPFTAEYEISPKGLAWARMNGYVD